MDSLLHDNYSDDGFFAGTLGNLGCAGCGGECGVLGEISVNSKGQTIDCTGTGKKRRCVIITNAQGYSKPVQLPISKPYTFGYPTTFNVNLPTPPTTQSPGIRNIDPQEPVKGQGWFTKSLDAMLTYSNGKNQRDVEIARTGMLPQYDPNQNPKPNDPQTLAIQRLQSQNGLLQQQNTQISDAGAMAGSAAGGAIDGIVQFVSANPLIVGLCAVGFYLLMKEPPKGRLK
jgi:hypothetical protein